MTGMTNHAWGRDLVTALISLQITSGEFLDGWAHLHGRTDDTFFTPWHAWLYAGLLAFGLWMAVVVWSTARRRRPGRPLMSELPKGYRGGIIGLAIFVFGAPSDFIWHSLFGFERSIAALLSPPHLMLLFGWLLIVTTAWRSQRSASATATVPEIISLGAVVALAGFFVAYKSPFRRAAVLTPFTDGDNMASEWVAAFLVTTVLLFVPLLWQIKDGRHRVGTLTTMVAMVGLGGALAVSQNWRLLTLLLGVAGAVVGAAVGELMYSRMRPVWSKWRYGLPIVMAEMAFLTWSGLYLGYSLSDPIRWPITIWGGSLLLAAGLAAALAAIAWRSPAPVPDRLDGGVGVGTVPAAPTERLAARRG
jgi:hypothetical protein